MNNQINQLVGLPVTNFRLIAGGSLILYIGAKRSDTETTEWRLHIDSAWRLDQHNKPVVGSLDTCVEDEEQAEFFLSALRQLQSETIEQSTIGTDIKDMKINFSSGFSLATFSHSLDGEGWELRCYDGRRLGMTENDITRLREWAEASD